MGSVRKPLSCKVLRMLLRSRVFKKLLGSIGYIHKQDINSKLDFARTIRKRLDEHRETVEDIENHTDLLKKQDWKISHLATMDDYLMQLFYFRHGVWPEDSDENPMARGGYLRARPAILGKCHLPEYPKEKSLEKRLNRFETGNPRSKRIQAVEVESDDGTNIVIHGKTVPKISEGLCYHNSFDQAHQHLLNTQEKNISKARERLELEEKFLHELYPITESDC